MSWFLALAGLVALLVLLRSFLFRGPIASPTEPPPSGIIDMHCHTAGIGADGSGCWVSPGLRHSWRFGVYLRIFGTSEKKLQQEGDGQILDIIARSIRASKHVDGAVILAMDAPYSADGQQQLELAELYVPNRFVGEAVKQYPELHFGASVHPDRPDALAELEWSKANGAVLLKWLPNIQAIDPADERYRPFYAKLVELDLPLLTHVGAEDSFSRANNLLGDPQRLRLPLECGVRVIAAHVASSGQTDGECNVQRLLRLMPEFPNLVADISTLTQWNRRQHLPTALNDERLRGRLLYGTDYPLTNTPLVTAWQFLRHLTLAEAWRISCIQNSWDRDVQLKAALGLKQADFTRSRAYLGNPISCPPTNPMVPEKL